MLLAHYKTYGRNFFSRYDYEEVDSAGAKDMMAQLSSQFTSSSFKGTKLGDFEVAEAGDFSYTDPIDGSVSKNQGLYAKFVDGNRIIFRLSGTGSAGATIRLYVEKYSNDEKEFEADAQQGLKPLIEQALKISELEKFTGRSKPTVITVSDVARSSSESERVSADISLLLSSQMCAVNTASWSHLYIHIGIHALFSMVLCLITSERDGKRGVHHCHPGLWNVLIRGRWVLTTPPVPMLRILFFSFASFSFCFSSHVFPSRSTMESRLWKLSLTPVRALPFGSIFLNFIPLPTHASLTTSRLLSIPFATAWSRARASVLLILRAARFGLNCICRMAKSMGFPPPIWSARTLSLRGEIRKAAVLYLCSVTRSSSLVVLVVRPANLGGAGIASLFFAAPPCVEEDTSIILGAPHRFRRSRLLDFSGSERTESSRALLAFSSGVLAPRPR